MDNRKVDVRRFEEMSGTELRTAVLAIRDSLSDRADCNTWLGVAQLAGGKARENLDISFAEAAIAAYSRIYALPEVSVESIENSEMLLRAYMIKNLGPIAGHPVLDPNILVKWFHSRLVVSDEEAKAAIRRWAEDRGKIFLDEGDTVLTLRRIKSRLNVIRCIANLEAVQADPVLQDWLRIRTNLP